jgi:phage repressor protein C with HTH and peptisase S24 domain
MNNEAQRIRYLIDYLNISQNKFSEKAELSSGLLTKVVNGKGSLSSDSMLKIVNAFGINAHWLLTGQGSPFLNEELTPPSAVLSDYQTPYAIPPPKTGIAAKKAQAQAALARRDETKERVYLLDDDVAAAAGAGALSAAVRDIHSYEYMEMPGLSRGRTYARVRVTGSSMKPTLYHEDFIIAARIEPGTYHAAIRDNNIYIVVTDSSDVLVKRVLNRIQERGQLWLKSDNPEYDSFNIDATQVLDVWEAKMRLTYHLSNTQADLFARVSRIEEELETMKLTRP